MEERFATAILAPQRGHRIWTNLLKKVESEGLTRPAEIRSLFRALFLFSILLILLYFSWTVDSTWIACALAALISLTISQFAFLAHDAGHGTLSRNHSFNRAIGHWSMTFAAGMCFDAWFRTHKTHHQYCQDPEKDPDMRIDLVASLSEESLKTKTKYGRVFTRFQDKHVWLLAFLFAFSQRHCTQWDAIRWRCLLDGFVTLLHLALWIVIPYTLFEVPISRILLVYTLPLLFLGPHLAAIFWVNHIGMPKVKAGESMSFLEHQALTSRTVQVPKGFRWLFGGLDCQIEHHLFCQIPSWRLRQVQVHVEGALSENNIPYNAASWSESIRAVSQHFSYMARLAKQRS